MKRFMLPVMVGIVAAMTLASAAAVDLTGGAGSVGSGDGVVTGYVVTNVVWGLEAGNVKTATFTIDGSPTVVDASTNGTKAGGVNPDSYDNWSCNIGALPTVVCTAGATVSPFSIYQLLVTAAN